MRAQSILLVKDAILILNSRSAEGKTRMFRLWLRLIHTGFRFREDQPPHSRPGQIFQHPDEEPATIH